MRVQEAVSALRGVGLRPARIEPIPGGWAFWTFDVDGSWIARFPRNDEIAHAARREMALLPELARHVSFGVPNPSHHGTWRDRPFFVYPRLAGRPLSRTDATPDVQRALGRMLAELHGFPVSRAADLLGTGPPGDSWREHFRRLWPVVETVALPAMDRDLADRVRKEFDRFLDAPFDFPHCLVHNDLGVEHILVDEATGWPSAIIDFESAAIGDPAIDLVPLRACLGANALEHLLAGRDLGDRLAERMWFYRWMGSVHAVIYGVTEAVDEERAGGVAELRRRLASHG